MKLKELLDLADKAYASEGMLDLASYYDEAGNHANLDKPGDTLAAFVVTELAWTFDPKLDDEGQLQEAMRVIGAAEKDLHRVWMALFERSSYPTLQVIRQRSGFASSRLQGLFRERG